MKIVIISGPTASGKSAAALEFANKHSATIINADAMQLYAGLPTLSSQPHDLERGCYRLYSILDPFDLTKNSSVVTWLELAKSAIAESFAQNKIPILVGGTGMYLSRLIYGIAKVPQVTEETKIQAQNLYSEVGSDEFKKRLIKLGEDENKVKILDRQRLLRNYQVILETGKSISWWHQNQLDTGLSSDSFVHLNLDPDRAELYSACDRRLTEMLKGDAVTQVKELLDLKLDQAAAIRNTIGFSEIESFLKEEISQTSMIEMISKKTKNYAKRQLTWFRNQFKVKPTFPSAVELIKFLNTLKNELL